MTNYIYLIMTQTGTRPARFFRFFTKKPYNHVSLSADERLSEMYSFCRTYCRFPLPATFNKEIVGKGTLGKFDSIPCEIYRIPVTSCQKTEYQRIIKHFNENHNVYSYNILGLLAVYFNIEWNRKKALYVPSSWLMSWIRSAFSLKNLSAFINPTISAVFPVRHLFTPAN